MVPVSEIWKWDQKILEYHIHDREHEVCHFSGITMAKVFILPLPPSSVLNSFNSMHWRVNSDFRTAFLHPATSKEIFAFTAELHFKITLKELQRIHSRTTRNVAPFEVCCICYGREATELWIRLNNSSVHWKCFIIFNFFSTQKNEKKFLPVLYLLEVHWIALLLWLNRIHATHVSSCRANWQSRSISLCATIVCAHLEAIPWLHRFAQRWPRKRAHINRIK